MRIWTIQPIELYNKLLDEKVIHCDFSQTPYAQDKEFKTAYEWMAAQMKNKIGKSPDGVEYPIWGWYRFKWSNSKPDLRSIEFRGFQGEMVCIELEIPDQKVLLSDEELWHLVLNNVESELWEHIFTDKGRFIQVTFWELRLDEVISVKNFCWNKK